MKTIGEEYLSFFICYNDSEEPKNTTIQDEHGRKLYICHDINKYFGEVVCKTVIRNWAVGNKPIVLNVIKCGICEENADRWINRFQCSKNNCHIGDLATGIFVDLTHPFER